jgi:hypothetical protein
MKRHFDIMSVANFWGGHAPSRAAVGVSPTAPRNSTQKISARVPKVRAGLALAREARALPK